MARYIDAVVAADKISKALGIELCDLVDVFADVKTADVAPVVHGRWIKTKSHDGKIVCSECGCKAGMWDPGDGYCYEETKFCPNCGCRMDLDGGGQN